MVPLLPAEIRRVVQSILHGYQSETLEYLLDKSERILTPGNNLLSTAHVVDGAVRLTVNGALALTVFASFTKAFQGRNSRADALSIGLYKGLDIHSFMTKRGLDSSSKYWDWVQRLAIFHIQILPPPCRPLALIHLSASLSVRGCGLEAIPANVRYMRNLRHLSLEDNRLSKVPRSVSLLRHSSVAADRPPG